MSLKQHVALVCLLLVLALLAVVTMKTLLPDDKLEQVQIKSFYLNFLLEQSEYDWHMMWKQLWELSDTVTVPRSIVTLYGDETKAADKVIELIASYGFWVDDSGTNGQYQYITYPSKMMISGVKYFSEAKHMQAAIDYTLPKVLEQVKVKGDLFKSLDNINQYLFYNTEYSEEGSMQGQTIYSVLIDKKAICGGFARTFNTLALLSGIDCNITVGYLNTTKGRIRHAWNTYTLNGVDYVADATNNRTSNRRDKVINRPVGDFYYREYEEPAPHAEAVHLIRN